MDCAFWTHCVPAQGQQGTGPARSHHPHKHRDPESRGNAQASRGEGAGFTWVKGLPGGRVGGRGARGAGAGGKAPGAGAERPPRVPHSGRGAAPHSRGRCWTGGTGRRSGWRRADSGRWVRPASFPGPRPEPRACTWLRPPLGPASWRRGRETEAQGDGQRLLVLGVSP